MSVTVLVTINIDNDDLEKFEAENPEIAAGVGEVAMKYMRRHRRISRPGIVIEVEEFEKLEDYNSFLAEAQDAIERYDTALGRTSQPVVYDDVVLTYGE